MTSTSERVTTVKLIQEAVCGGARRVVACEACGICKRTYIRWCRDGEIQSDLRPTAQRPEPENKLSEDEKARIIAVCTSEKYVDSTPMQIVPELFDQNIYLASESTYYRVLHEHNLVKHRGRSRPPQNRATPSTFEAFGPNEVWTWDITYLPTQVKGLYFYLHLAEDLFSRMIVGATVHAEESGNNAAEFIEKTVLAQRCSGEPLVLHSDNGAPMKSQTMRSKVEELGLTSSFSRPRVSNDNPFVESLFRTLKYCPQWPEKGFENLAAAQKWVDEFVAWYNTKHRHSKIRFVTPQQRHLGEDIEILKHRASVLREARANRPERWGSRDIRNCTPIRSATLNPEREQKQM